VGVKNPETDRCGRREVMGKRGICVIIFAVIFGAAKVALSETLRQAPSSSS
jgi:hypothetical protein